MMHVYLYLEYVDCRTVVIQYVSLSWMKQINKPR